MSLFKELFPKSHKPEINDLDLFFSNELANLLHEFSSYLLDKYDLRFGIPTWSEENGWVYRIGKSGVYLFTGLVIEEEQFTLDQISVRDRSSYLLLLEHIHIIYTNEKTSFLQKIAEKNKRQAERNAIRIQKEKEERDLLQEKINRDKFNKFKWPVKLDVQKLRQLYLMDAKGIKDEFLADEIGIILYQRCKYGKEDMELMDRYIIRCHNCNQNIAGNEDFRECNCGFQYSYKEYRRSYRRNNMPSGAAAKVFNEYIQNWERAKDYDSKLLLIDKLLHEFHLSLISGAPHRPVAMNFIDGTREKVEKIINDLAYH